MSYDRISANIQIWTFISKCFVRCTLGILPLRSFSFSWHPARCGPCMRACMWALTCLFSNWAQLVCVQGVGMHVGPLPHQCNSFIFSFFSERSCISMMRSPDGWWWWSADGSSFGGNLAVHDKEKGKTREQVHALLHCIEPGFIKTEPFNRWQSFSVSQKNMPSGGPPGIKLKQGRLLMFLVN